MKILKFAITLAMIFIFSSSAFALDSAEVINNFAFNAAKLLAKSSNDGNFLFSPYSIITAFGMVYAGARGNTAGEIDEALNFSPEIHKALSTLMNNFDSSILSQANRVWIQNGLSLHDDYKLLLADDYQSSVYQLDFAKDPDSSRNFINNWISSKTHDRIKNLLSQLAPDTLMILTNAIYFNAAWLEPFDSKYTKPKSFSVPGQKNLDVPMMQKRERFQYGDYDGTKIIRLPYEKGYISMLVLLPENGETGLENLNHSAFTKMTSSMRSSRVDLWLPKFKTESKFNLNDLFKELGVKTAFTNNADFSGITDDEKLKIDAIIHQTFIEVDEKKTEAAAATAITMVRATAAPGIEEIKEFHADRPFLYFVVDDSTDTILFMGRQTFKQ